MCLWAIEIDNFGRVESGVYKIETGQIFGQGSA
jgi:hypothetical protein